MTDWTPICKLEDIPVLGARRVARERGLEVAVFRTADDQVYAVLDRCPHRGGPLSQGLVMGTSVACPLHGWTIGLDDGCARAPDEGSVPRFACRISDGAVQLDAAELASVALDLTRPRAGPGGCSGRAACEQSAAQPAPQGA